MAIATATSLDVHMGGELLFADVSFKLEPRERMTLSGRNGAGKSTLLRLLAGELSPDAGSLVLQRGARVALHDQRPPRETATSLGEYVFSGRTEMLETEAELERLEGAMSRGETGEDTLAAYAAAQQRLEHGGGYRWRDGVLAVLRGLGFGGEEAERPLSTFSGGELTRASLARALATRPDLLLLDEPTNHLDIPSLEWLERYLADLDAAVVLVAHDRWFLEAVGTSVLELEAQRARFFAGPWHAWRKEQAAREIARGKAIERQEAEIARMERFVERFRYKATKARQAQSRLKQIDKIKRDGVEAEQRDRRNLRFSFVQPERPGRVVLKLVGATIEVPGRTLLADARLEVERGEHVVLVGPNGAGKTTLIETLAGRREPAAGSVRTGHNVKLGYLSQHADTAAGEGTVLDAAQRRDGAQRPEGARPARRLPLLGRRRREAAERHLRRRAAAALAGDPGRLRCQRADPRRADQPPRHREPRGARGRAAGVRGRGGPRLPRPGPAGGGRHPHAGLRGRRAAQPPDRLGRLPARARRTRSDGGGGGTGRQAGQGVGARPQCRPGGEESGAQGWPPRRADRAGGGGSARAGGGALRSGSLVEPGPGRAGGSATRGRQTGGR